MMGTKLRDFAPLPNLSLEELVPKDNFYRRLDARLDLSFVRGLVRECYACSGRPSVDPVVFFKLQLVLFFEDLRSERQLMGIVADRLSIRWYLGYDLDEPLPDHSSLTRIRERYGLEVFRRFFERIVEECLEAGLVWGEELFFDSTKVRANADVDSLRSRSIAENHLKELFEESASSESKIEDFDTLAPTPDEALTDALPMVGDERVKEDNAQKSKDWISRDGSQDRTFTSGPRKRTADDLISTTDPDATPMRISGSETKLGYQAHYVVDGGKARVILNVLVTPSEVSENRPMLDLLWRAAFRWRLWPRHVTGDAKYGTAENVRAIESAGIRAYVAPHESGGKGKAFFGKGEFVYDPKRDLYLCPAGEELHRTGKSGKGIRYRANISSCQDCRLKERCTPSEGVRSINRYPSEEYVERVRTYRHTEPYKKAMRKRKVWIEPLFAEAKEWHGMRRFRLRRLKKANIEALMVAAGQNIKRLVGASRRGPRSLPQEAALCLPKASFYSICRARRSHRCVPRRRKRSFSTSWTVFDTLPLHTLLFSALRRTYLPVSRTCANNYLKNSPVGVVG